MKSRPTVLAAAIVLLVAVPAIALGSSARSETNTQTYQDSAGEDAAAPDVTTVTVSNDDTGLITFQINIANRPALTPDMLIDIFVDSDNNTATGAKDFFGSEYAIELQAGAVDLFQWNGTTFAGGATQSSLIFSYTAAGAVIKVSAAELGKTKAFNFIVDAASGIAVNAAGAPDFTNAHDDIAPDPGHGTYAYQVLAKLILKVVAFATSPSPAKAGKTFSAGMAVTENDTNSAVKQGTVACTARIAGKAITAKAHRIVNGVASCVWPIPKTATGKTIRGTVVLTVRGVTISRNFAARIAAL
jgi:hypothetical protein